MSGVVREVCVKVDISQIEAACSMIIDRIVNRPLDVSGNAICDIGNRIVKCLRSGEGYVKAEPVVTEGASNGIVIIPSGELLELMTALGVGAVEGKY